MQLMTGGDREGQSVEAREECEDAGPQFTACLMWQKWFLVVGFPKHEPIFFF